MSHWHPGKRIHSTYLTNSPSPEPSSLDANISSLQRWRLTQKLVQDFWKRWSTEYLARLQQRPKWTKETETIKIDELVLVRSENTQPSKWALARVTEVHPGPDGKVRVVTLRCQGNHFMKRPITKISRMPIDYAVEEENAVPDDPPKNIQSNLAINKKPTMQKNTDQPFERSQSNFITTLYVILLALPI